MPDRKLPVSVAIIVLNEEERLPGCLASVDFVREIVVVDSGSVDRTVAIAREFGAMVHDEPWQGFGRQKQLAIDRCGQPWVLVLDADERVSPELALELKALVAGGARHAAYSMPRKNFFCGRWIRHAGWWPDRIVRFFQNGKARMSDRLVHEGLLVDGPVGELRNPLIHHANRDLAQTLAKINKYSTAGAEELFKKGVKSSLLKAVLRAQWGFAHNYLLRGGFLDGAEGFILAVTDAVNIFFKYLKLREMRKRASRRNSAIS
ncbi:glycosyltransferase family 2 protein [Thiovibrio sp. JS02]